MLQGQVFSPLLFNIYIRSLGELIHHHGMRYHHHADDIQQYISVPGKLRDAVDVLAWCLETVSVLMGNNRL